MNNQGPPLNRQDNQHTGEPFGRWMIYAAWVLLIILLTFSFSQWLDDQHNPNRDLMVTHDMNGNSSVTLQRNRAGHYVASGIINSEPVVFLIDTGATHVALSADLADRLGLERGVASTSITANGQVSNWLTRLDELQLGSIIMRNVRASILPSMAGNEVLLGMSFLQHLEFIQQDGHLILRIPDG